MKLLILTALCGRPKVAQLFFMGLKRIIQTSPEGLDITVLAIVSNDEDARQCNENGIRSYTTKNNPVGNKWNDGLRVAFDTYQWDYVMLSNDDNVYHNEMLRRFTYKVKYLKEKGESAHHLGFRDIYFYSPASEIAISFSADVHKPANVLMGCGRFISREAVGTTMCRMKVKFNRDVVISGITAVKGTYAFLPLSFACYLEQRKYVQLLGTKIFELWDGSIDSGLDGSLELNLISNGYRPVVIDTTDPIMMDVKSDINIHKIEDYIPFGRRVTVEMATKFLPNEEIDYIREKLKT